MQHHHYGRQEETQQSLRRWPMTPRLKGRAAGLLSIAVLSIAALMLSGCQQQRAAMAMPAPEVEVATVLVQDVPITKEWVGTLDGRVNAQIRGQVSGLLMKQNYTEGSFVRTGQLLFEIDPRPFQAALNLAKGSLAQAEANVQMARANLAQNKARLGKANLDVSRYTPLAKTKAISQEELDNAVQSQLEATAAVESTAAAIESGKAAIASAKAAVEDAELKLSFTKIIAPIDGIAGLAKAQVGDLISPAGGELTTVSTVDPIKAYFTVSEQEYINRDSPLQSAARGQSGKLELVLADGSVYAHKGTFYMADRQVDVGTGTLRVAALFPNPGNFLRPGQYGQIRAVLDTRKNAILVPQRAVTELQGTYQVAVVGSDKIARVRKVKLGDRIGGLWVIEDGVAPGESVIVEGIQKVRDGVPVQPKPYTQKAEAR
jgi:membrane fusion protein (multidrug efflux system)